MLIVITVGLKKQWYQGPRIYLIMLLECLMKMEINLAQMVIICSRSVQEIIMEDRSLTCFDSILMQL